VRAESPRCDEWTQFHGNGANSGFRAVDTVVAPLTEIWKAEAAARAPCAGGWPTRFP